MNVKRKNVPARNVRSGKRAPTPKTEWRPISEAPRNEWLLVSCGGPVTNPGGFGWHIARVTEESLSNSPPYAVCWGGGSYMGVKWFMPLPPLRVNRPQRALIARAKGET